VTCEQKKSQNLVNVECRILHDHALFFALFILKQIVG